MSNELTPEGLKVKANDIASAGDLYGEELTSKELRQIADAWEADKQRIDELEASVKYALSHTLNYKTKQLDAPCSADMHLSQAIDRLNSAIQYEAVDAERAEHLNYAVELMEMTRPKK